MSQQQDAVIGFDSNFFNSRERENNMNKNSTASLLFLLLCTLASTVAGANADRQKQALSPDFARYSAEEFYKTTSMRGSSINHTGDAILATNDQTGVFNVYRYPFAGGKPKQLTFSKDNAIYGVSWFPKDDRFLFTSDQGGNELNHLYVQNSDGSQRDLTPGENVKARFAGWKKDNKAFFVMTNERDAKYFDLYEYQIADFSRKLAFKNEIANHSIQMVSANGRWLVSCGSRGEVRLWG